MGSGDLTDNEAREGHSLLSSRADGSWWKFHHGYQGFALTASVSVLCLFVTLFLFQFQN